MYPALFVSLECIQRPEGVFKNKKKSLFYSVCLGVQVHSGKMLKDGVESLIPQLLACTLPQHLKHKHACG